MKKWIRPAICCGAFVAVCVFLAALFHVFTQGESGVVFGQWDSAVVTGAQGDRAFDPLGQQPELAAGESLRYTMTLPQRDHMTWMVFDMAGGQLRLLLNGEELFAFQASSREDAGNGQAQIPLPPGGGEELVAYRVPQEGAGWVTPLNIRFMDDPTDQAGTIAYANQSAFPAGVTALALALVWGLFLLGVGFRHIDWSQLPLSLAAAVLLVHRLAASCGVYFLPQPLWQLWTWPGWGLVALGALAVYLLMNRRRDFWRGFGWAALISAVVLLLAYGISRTVGGGFSAYLESLVRELALYGRYENLVYWLTFWLVGLCALLSGGRLIRSIAQREGEIRAIQVRYDMTVKNHQEFVEKTRQTAAMRHEWKNQLAALSLLLEKGDVEGLGKNLRKWQGELDRLSTHEYTGQAAINAILQREESRAQELGVAFHCQVLAPSTLEVDEGDLCALLFNLLDNALEAAGKGPQPRWVHVKIQYVHGFLAIRCENTYNGVLETDSHGNLRSTKKSPESHGFGLAQIRQVAAKYQSVLNIDYNGKTFLAQTALQLHPPRDAGPAGESPA